MPTDPAPRPAAARYQTIDAWRGIASLGVVAFHSFGPYYRGRVWAPLVPLRAGAHFGWLGLDLFFVLSGYCIFERLEVAVRRGETAADFWVDRAWRILPGYWAAMALSLVLAVAAWPFNSVSLAASLPASWPAFGADLSLTHVLFGFSPYIIVSWTLTCELAFYLLAGLLLAATRGRLNVAFGLGAALCVLAAFCRPAGWTLPLSAWPEFFAGAGVSFVLRAHRRRDRAAAGAGLIVLAGLAAAAWYRWGSYASDSRRFALGVAVALLALHRWDGWLIQRAPIRLLAWVGTFSYSLYLIHVQVLTRIMNAGSRVVAPHSPGFAVLWLAGTATAVACAWMFWSLVERPSEERRVARRAERSRLRKLAAAPAVA